MSDEVVHSGDAPYTQPLAPIPVRVAVHGELRAGEVLGWRDDRVYVRYRTDAGTHLGWMAATAVVRL